MVNAVWVIRSLLASIAEHTPLSMSVEEYEWLYRYAENAYSPFLDIGTHYGLSALVMVEAKKGAEVLTIDNLADFGGDKKGTMPEECGKLVKNRRGVTLIIGESAHIVPTRREKFGLVLIDGSHLKRDVATDINNCKNVPIVLVHDAFDGGPAAALENWPHRLLPANKINADWDIEPRGLAVLEKG